MKKPLIAAALFATTVFGAGYTIGQVGGATSSSAATVATPGVSQSAPDNGSANSNAQDAPHADSPHADGTVTAINGDTLTISAGTDPSGTTEYTSVTTVQLTGSTQYDAGHDNTAAVTKSSIKVGSYVIVYGTLSSDGKTITASRLGINANGPVPGR